MYLQVECDNIPALRPYGRTGFDEVCGYHYRTPRMNLVICPWRTTVYVLGVLDALADLPA
ncbi:MAG TPA: hypothetical protein VE645_10590 [Pseudonocardiaceae bacterium]|nr:hypothetical protein [Pseudonocardiaceae bacterium]